MIPVAALFTAIPRGLRDALLEAHKEIVQNYAESRWEPSELNGGKLSEVVYSIINGAIQGNYPSVPAKPRNIVDACRQLEQVPPNAALVGDRSFRIQIPRALVFLYEIRNNRGVGHVGGDVNPNYSDATVVLAIANWMVAELIRILHSVALAEAQATVNALVERKHPLIWDSGAVKRVLKPELSMKDQTLALLYGENGWVDDKSLFSSVEYSALGPYRSNVLKELHRDRLLEYEVSNRRAKISPLGVKYVEQSVLKQIT